VIVEVPKETPLTVPVMESTLAILASLLLQVPPEGEQLSIEEPDGHILSVPEMPLIPAITFTVFVAAAKPQVLVTE
jgi:hypothetical protein